MDLSVAGDQRLAADVKMLSLLLLYPELKILHSETVMIFAVRVQNSLLLLSQRKIAVRMNDPKTQ